MNGKVKSFKQCFYRNSVQCRKLQPVFEVQSFHLDAGPPVSLVYCPVDNTLFEVSPEIRCSDVSSLYCCYGNMQLVLSQFKNVLPYLIEN